MKKLLLLLALLLPASAFADRVRVYDNASVYLFERPCKNGDGLKAGEIRYKTGKVLGMCWVEENGAVWIIDDNGGIAAEDAKPFKELVAI